MFPKGWMRIRGTLDDRSLSDIPGPDAHKMSIHEASPSDLGQDII